MLSTRRFRSSTGTDPLHLAILPPWARRTQNLDASLPVGDFQEALAAQAKGRTESVAGGDFPTDGRVEGRL